jgi:DNA polymerase III epsilon subunit family exonuclease
MLKISEFRKRALKCGALVEPGMKVESYYFLWYGSKETPTVILNTVTTSKEYVKSRFKKIYSEVKFEPGMHMGFGTFRLGEPFQFHGSKEVGPKKENPPQEEDKFIIHLPMNDRAKKDSYDDLSGVKILSALDLSDYVVVDTETTGMSKKDEVVELAGLVVKDFKIVDRFHSYIIPTVPMTVGAQRIHGLTVEFLKKHGRDATEVYREFKEFLKGLPVVGHNVKFDIRMMKSHSSKCKIKIDFTTGFDTLILSRKAMKRSNHKLQNILLDYDLKQGLKAHNAMDDVVGTLRYASILERSYRESCKIEVGS